MLFFCKLHFRLCNSHIFALVSSLRSIPVLNTNCAFIKAHLLILPGAFIISVNVLFPSLIKDSAASSRLFSPWMEFSMSMSCCSFLCLASFNFCFSSTAALALMISSFSFCLSSRNRWYLFLASWQRVNKRRVMGISVTSS